MLCLCESDFSVYMTGPGVCVLYWIPAYLECTQCSIPNGYLLHTMHLFIADITKLIQTRLCDGVAG